MNTKEQAMDLEPRRSKEDEFFESLTNTRDSVFVPDLNLMYQRVPKVASTSVSGLILSMLLDDPKREALGNANMNTAIFFLIPRLTDYPRDYIYNKLHSPDFVNFTFVRNPYTKLVSFYNNKIAPLGSIKETFTQKDPAISKALEGSQHFYEGPKYITYNAKARILAGKEPYVPYSSKFVVATFDEFARFVCSQKVSEMDHHWEPQVVTTNWNKIPYTYVGKMETYAEDIEKILQLIKSPDKFYPIAQEKTNASKKQTSLTEYYSADLQDLVYNKFIEDFQAFNYSQELPNE